MSSRTWACSPRSASAEPQPCCTVSTDDADAVWQRAVEGGAEVRQPLAEAFWGERYGQITDPFGHRWGLAQHIRDVPREQLERAVAELFAG